MEAPPPIQVVETPDYRFGRWTASDLGNYTGANTLNESGSEFGLLCGTQCVYYVNLQHECDSGESYPGMVNSPAGSAVLTLHCYHLDKIPIMIFEPKELSETAFAKGGEIGFAVPLKSGRFGVSRFSLDGSLQALEKATSIAVQKQNARQQGLRDFAI
jgi:hypothetical protein